MAEFTNLERLIKLIGDRRAVELFDDDNDRTITQSDDAVAFAMDSANAFVGSAIFRKGFSVEQVEALASDASLQRYATCIFAQYAGQRKPEFTDAEGRAPFHAMGEQARKDLAAIAAGELRSLLEASTVGANPIVGGDVSTACPPFIVNRDPRYPGSQGPGGF